MELAGKVALVTAAAGAGIGKAAASKLAEAGASVVVTDKHERRTAEVADEIARETGRDVIGIPLDVTDEVRVEAVVKQAIDHFGQLDILVNDSGINELTPIWKMSTETWRKVIDLCLTAHFFTIRAVLPHMIERRRGAIVNMSSAGGWVGSAEGEAHYSAAKAGVMGLTRAVAAEAAPYGIRANAIAPGLIYNEFLGRIYPPDFFVEAEKRAALKRSGKPPEVAELILFLASDRSSYITGETICISGGSYFHA